MFRSIDLIDFQSHKTTHLPLGPFTVIVGPSSSGKSAVVRALRLVVDNARGTAYVRQGAKASTVSLELAGNAPVRDASTVVTVERGKNTSVYTLRMPGAHGEPVVYTKCASNVPEGITRALGAGDSSLWIAGQFDSPFLLNETGAEVARVLGKLTNVNLIYAAARETNRRVSEARRLHTQRAADLEAARDRITLYVTLPQRLASGEEAQRRLDAAEQLAARRAGLAERLQDAREAQTRLSRARNSIISVPSTDRLLLIANGRSALAVRLEEARSAARRRAGFARDLLPVPDVSSLGVALARRASLKEALAVATRAAQARSDSAARVADLQAAASDARNRFSSALESAGSCPLCGAPASHAQVERVV